MQGMYPPAAALGLHVAGGGGDLPASCCQNKGETGGRLALVQGWRRDGGRSIQTPERVKSEALSAHLALPDLLPPICVQACPGNTR